MHNAFKAATYFRPMQPIKNIIFDLGGIFMNIDFKKTEQAFINLGVTDFPAMFNQHHVNDLFEDLETGKITPAAFYEAFRQATGKPLTDTQIKDAWNALLLDFPPVRINWLENISKKYNVYLFSNTNLIHYEAFLKIFQQNTGKTDLNQYFLKAYYSHEMGLRKPHVAAFQHILNEQNLHPEETLFIDDTIGNIKGAKEAGLQTIHLVAPITVLELGL
jgi:putative hydrolase of the HAD superfamily